MSKGRKKKHTVRNIVLILLLLCIVGGVVFWQPIKNAASKKAAEVVVEKLLDDKIDSDQAVYGKLSAQDIYDSMDDADKEAVTDIVTDHMSAENIKNVEQYVASGDTAGLKAYVKETLSSEETQVIEDMYEKYKDQLGTTAE